MKDEVSVRGATVGGLSLLLLSSLLGAVTAGQRPDVFQRLEAAPLIVTARVDRSNTFADDRVVLSRIAIEATLKGSAPIGQPPVVVQDLAFPSDRPWLAESDERVLVLEPLPQQSRFERLPTGGSYWRLMGGAGGALPTRVVSVLRSYLAALEKPKAERERACVGALLGAVSDPDLGADAVSTLSGRPKLSNELDPPRREVFARLLRESALPVERRRALLDLIRERRLTSLAPAVRGLLAEPAWAPFARQTLVALGGMVTAEAVGRDLAADDPEARIAALRVAAALSVAERIEPLGRAASSDPDHAVRLEAIAQLGRAGAPAVPELGRLLADPDARISYYSARALADVGGEGAIAQLTRQFREGSYDAQVAAVFALRRIGSEQALKALADVEANPPDARLRRVIEVAAGRAVDHH